MEEIADEVITEATVDSWGSAIHVRHKIKESDEELAKRIAIEEESFNARVDAAILKAKKDKYNEKERIRKKAEEYRSFLDKHKDII